MASVAFVLVGSAFFYFVNWFSEVKRARSEEVVQTAAITVLRKLPPVDGTSYSRSSAVENRDLSPAPEEPDPASPIDYVLQKRRLSL